ncbi:MAG: DUF1684 domain-containing protein [bacterium]
MIKNLFRHNLALILVLILSSCKPDYSPEEKEYIAKIEQHRKDQNVYFMNSPDSPFNLKGKVRFHELNYFEVDPKFKFTSRIFEYQPKDTLTIYGTKGEARKTVKYGFITFKFEERNHILNVYESVSRDGEKYYSIWFTDKTTNDESYGVGRYLDLEKKEDPEYLYTIDFNLAYNPYCAYSPDYSCAIPTKEDYLDIEVEAGEKKFHD